MRRPRPISKHARWLASAIALMVSWQAQLLAATNLTDFTNMTVGDELDAVYAIVNDDQTVVYAAGSVTQDQLYSVRFDDPAMPINLSQLPPAAGTITTVKVTEDGLHAVYTVRTGSQLMGFEQLFSARVDGTGSPIALTDTISLFTANFLDGGGLRYDLSNDSQFVVYVSNHIDPITMFPTSQLYSVPVTGGPSNELSDAADSISFEVSLDGLTVAYTEQDLGMGMLGGELKTVATAGGTRRTLSEPAELVYDFEIARDSQRIAFAALQPDLSSELISATLLGTNVTELDALPAPTGTTASPVAILLQVTPDSNRVAYVYTDGMQSSTLKSVAIGGGTPLTLDPEGSSASGLIVAFQITADSNWVVYGKGTLASAPGNELLSVSVAGGSAPNQLSTGFSTGGFFFGFPTRDSQHVVFGRSDLVTNGIDPEGFATLYRIAIGGSGQRNIVNSPLTSGGHVRFFFPYFDSARVLYLADQNSDDQFELFEAPIFGGPALRLNDPLIGAGDVTEGVLTPNPDRVVFRADQNVDGVFDLFFADSTGPAEELVFSDGFE